MTTIQLLACIGMITGSFLLFGLAPMEFTDGLFSFLTREKSSIKDEIKAAQRRQKQGFLKREIRMAQDILTMTGRSRHFSLLCACSLLLFGIGALPAGKRKDMLAQTLDGLMGLFRDRVLPYDTDAARRFAELAVTAKNGGRGFPTPDGYIAAIAASRGFIVASRDTAPYEAATVAVINPWKV